MNYDLICIDMFQTLVDVHSRGDIIWKRILENQHTEALANTCKTQFHQLAVQGFFKHDSSENTFRTLAQIFEPYFQQLADEMRLNIDPQRATQIFLEEHNFAAPYKDTIDFFQALTGKVKVCLVSDADAVMLVHLLKQFTFDKVFMSENIKAYKNDPQGRMFNAVIRHYQLDPNRMLHIGDGNGDIAGANRAGIQSCWINRTGTAWCYEEKPLFEVSSLTEVMQLI